MGNYISVPILLQILPEINQMNFSLILIYILATHCSSLEPKLLLDFDWIELIKL